MVNADMMSPRTWSPDDQSKIIEIFKMTGALIEGHFVYAKGSKPGDVGPDNPRRHGKAYVAKDEVYPLVQHFNHLAESIADEFRHEGLGLVIGISPVANVLAHDVAKHLTSRGSGLFIASPRSIAAEKRDGHLIIRPSWAKLIVPERRILLVEDIVNSGGSAIELRELVEHHGGEDIAGVAALWSRNGKTAEDLGVKQFFSLCDRQYEAWHPDDCPLCHPEEGEPMPVDERYGHGTDYIKDGY